MSNGIQSPFLRAGLDKALEDELFSILDYVAYRIDKEVLETPDHMSDWLKGPFSFVYVRAVEYWGNHFLRELETMAMARKGSTRNQRKQINYTFVRCELNKDTKVAAAEWIQKNGKVIPSKIHSLMGEGHKISLSLSQEKDTFTASATGQEGSNNEGLILTARHKDWWIALQTLVYKHEEMFEEGLWNAGEEDDDGWS